MKVYIARDPLRGTEIGGALGRLFLFRQKPIKKTIYGQTVWHVDEDRMDFFDSVFEIDSSAFPEVTFENSPQLVEVVLKTKKP